MEAESLLYLAAIRDKRKAGAVAPGEVTFLTAVLHSAAVTAVWAGLRRRSDWLLTDWTRFFFLTRENALFGGCAFLLGVAVLGRAPAWCAVLRRLRSLQYPSRNAWPRAARAWR
jgi:hypothetical protein